MALKQIQCLSVLMKNLKLSHQVCVNPVRSMSKVKRRHTVPPFWWAKTTRATYPEHLTTQNKGYLKEVIDDRYSSPLRVDRWERGEWRERSVRCGLIAKKIGIYPMWTKDGKRLLTTLLQVSENHVIKYIEPEEVKKHAHKRRYREFGALVVGSDYIDPRLITKEYYNIFSETGIMPKKKLTKFIVTPNAKLPPGTPLYASHFRPGNYVDIAGTTIDRGFHGVMKRWSFKGMPASHGVTKSHRRGGCIGSGGEKARVLPGQKMPGHMGREKRIIRGLKVWRVNTHYNVLWVQGPAVPGDVGSYVTIYDSLLPDYKQTQDAHPPFPTLFQDEEEHMEEELCDGDLHPFHKQSIQFVE